MFAQQNVLVNTVDFRFHSHMANEKIQGSSVILTLDLLVLPKNCSCSVKFSGLKSNNQSINDQLILIWIVKVKIIM